MSDLSFRPLRESDLDPITEIENLSHPTPWSYGMFLSELGRDNSVFFVFAEASSQRIIGYGGFWNMVGDGNITNLTIAPAFRGEGYGRRLLEFLLSEMRRRELDYASLEVRESNQAAIRLYESAGFEKLGSRPGYYSNGETALIYGLRLAT